MALVIQENIPLNQYTTFKTGGAARYFVEVKSEEEVKEAGRFSDQKAQPHLNIGGGSNLLISDEGFSGLVILNSLKGRTYTEEPNGEVILVVSAGEMFDDVIAETVVLGYWGLENLSGIPGTVGATPVQNVGAYGVEVAELISSVETYNFTTHEKKVFTKKECEFNYRESFFKKENGKNFFITKVNLKLSKEKTPKLFYADLKNKFLASTPTQEEIRKTVIEIRAQKFPDWKVYGTAGSFFKNPIIEAEQLVDLLLQYPELPHYEAGAGMVKIPLGYVLDKLCGLKGYRNGKVGLFKEQALVLVNYSDATSEEIKNFATKIAEKVFTKTKIIITPEVRFIEFN